MDSLNRILATRYGAEKLIRSRLNYQLNLDPGKIDALRLDLGEIKKICIAWLERQPGISYAMDVTKIVEAPLLFMGWGIKPGHANAAVSMTDIAPAAAALLHIQMPNGAVGKPIREEVESVGR